MEEETVEIVSLSTISKYDIHFFSEYLVFNINFASKFMIVSFEKEYLSELYYFGRCSDKKHRYQPDIIRRYKQRIDILNDVTCIEALWKIHSLNYEVLQGDKSGISSIRVNDKYRIEFLVSRNATGSEVIDVCNIIDLTNHYK